MYNMYNSVDRRLRAAVQFRQFSLRVVREATNETSMPDVHLLPEHHALVVNGVSSCVTLVDWQRGKFLAHCSFRDDELPLVILLLEGWPSYVPYEQFFPLLDIELTEQLQRDLERLKTSRQDGESEYEKALNEEARLRIQPVLHPIRMMLAGCRSILHEFGLTIVAVKDCGPLLTRYTPLKAQQDLQIGCRRQEEGVINESTAS